MTQNNENFTGRLMIYRDTDNNIQVDAILNTDNEVWNSKAQLAELFQVSVDDIEVVITEIFTTGEMFKTQCLRIRQYVDTLGNKQHIEYYNLKMIIAVGLRLNSKIATELRMWSNNHLTTYVLDNDIDIYSIFKSPTLN